MKTGFVASAAALVLLTTAGVAEAKGCIKGAIVGGIAGHFAGRHATVGAIGGCAVGHHLAKKKEQERRRVQYSGPRRS